MSEFFNANPALLGQLTTVNHQGVVISFARDVSPGKSGIWYNALALKTDSVKDNDDWTGYAPLSFPHSLRPAGAGIITLDNSDGNILKDAGLPFKVLSDQQWIYLFRQSNKNTLMVNRYIMRPGQGLQGGSFILDMVWETRFQRSGKEDIPESKKDSQGYQDLIGDPFIEPIVELSMISDLYEGWFDVVILPNGESKFNNWQFFAVKLETGQPDQNRMDLYSFPADEKGLFNLVEKTCNENGEIEPDSSFYISWVKDKINPMEERVVFNNMPTATFYSMQENVAVSDSVNTLVKRAGRLMLAVPVAENPGQTSYAAIVDFGVSGDGMLAKIGENTMAESIGPANYALSFDGSDYITLENQGTQLLINGSFMISGWICADVTSTGVDQMIIGGSSVSDVTCAPFIQLTANNGLLAGFGTGTKVETVETENGIITNGVWYHISVAYRIFDKNAFEITINGAIVAASHPAATVLPGMNPISAIGGLYAGNTLSNGFMGFMDNIEVSSFDSKNNLNVAGYWDFNDVKEITGVPTVKDASGNGNNGILYGPSLVLSTSPNLENTGSNGTMQIDEGGLAIYTGILEQVQPKSGLYLMGGTDGLLHLYFEGVASKFSVAQFDTRMSRAVFEGAWNAGDDTGKINFIAIRSGIYMNSASISVSPEKDPDFYKVLIDNGAGTVETWRGVPALLDNFIAVMNGQSTSILTDPLLKTGAKVFYDANGLYPTCYIPMQSNDTPEFISIISSKPETLPLHSIQISNGSSPSLHNVTISFDPIKWNSGKSPNDMVYLTERWNNVAGDYQTFMSILSGFDRSYDYSSKTNGQKMYSLQTNVKISAEENHTILVICQLQSTLSITVSEDSKKDVNDTAILDPAKCTVKITLNTKNATWHHVNRNQVNTYDADGTLLTTGFVSTLNAYVQKPDENNYNYKDFAIDDYQAISESILLLCDELDASVMNTDKPVEEAYNNLAMTKFFSIINSAQLFTDENIMSGDNTFMAQILQQSLLVTPGDQNVQPLLSGSTLFGVNTTSLPVTGAKAFVAAADPNLIAYAKNGGWMQEPPQYSLLFNQNMVDIPIIDKGMLKNNARSLSIIGDMTAELWCKPDVNTKLPVSLLNFNSMDTEIVSQYSLGLKKSFCLDFTKGLYIVNSGQTTPLFESPGAHSKSGCG